MFLTIKLIGSFVEDEGSRDLSTKLILIIQDLGSIGHTERITGIAIANDLRSRPAMTKMRALFTQECQLFVCFQPRIHSTNFFPIA